PPGQEVTPGVPEPAAATLRCRQGPRDVSLRGRRALWAGTFAGRVLRRALRACPQVRLGPRDLSGPAPGVLGLDGLDLRAAVRAVVVFVLVDPGAADAAVPETV